MEKESNNSVKVSYKQSSSTGKIGYDAEVNCSTGATEEEMIELANLALKTAKAIRDKI